MRVQVAVPEVVYGAAGAAHDDCAGEEEERGADDGGGGRGGEREGRRHQGRPEAGPVQVVGARGLVEAEELGVGDPGDGEKGEEALCGWGVSWEGCGWLLVIVGSC